MPTTSELALPYPALSAAPNVPADIQALADRIEAIDFPRGSLGYAQVTANQASITAEVDLTGLSVAVTAGASRRLRISVGLQASSTGTDETVKAYIKEGATYLRSAAINLGTTGIGNSIEFAVVVTPTTGAHTYKVSMERNTAFGSVTSVASATSPAYILVEDIGV